MNRQAVLAAALVAVAAAFSPIGARHHHPRHHHDDGAFTPSATAAPAGETIPARVLQPGVTEENGRDVLCVVGYSRTIRMSREDARRVKRELLADAGLPPEVGRNFQLDHRLNLALGSTNDRANLRLEPIAEAERKDQVENEAHDAYCRGELTLARARAMVWTWRP